MSHQAKTGVKWTAVVVTCQNRYTAQAYQRELLCRQRLGSITKDAIVLCIEDPKSGVGSGGATLNALLVVTEHLSAKQGYNVVNADVLKDTYILIIHMGRNFAFDACGGAFVTLPLQSTCSSQSDSLVCNIDILLEQMTHHIATRAPPGVWMCSSDMILDLNAYTDSVDIRGDVSIVCVPSDVSYATDHGVLKLDKQGNLQDIVFRGSTSEIEACSLSDGKVPLISGIVYFSSTLAERFLMIINDPPLDCCTYLGLDSGAQPLQMSIFFDFMLACCSAISKQDFVLGERSNIYAGFYVNKPASTRLQAARTILWDTLRNVSVHTVLLHGATHHYLDWYGRTLYKLLYNGPFSSSSSLHSSDSDNNRSTLSPPWAHRTLINTNAKSSIIGDGVVVLNSTVSPHLTLPPHSVLTHSSITTTGNVHIHGPVVLAGLTDQDFKTVQQDAVLHKDSFMQSFYIRPPHHHNTQPTKVLTITGLHDNIRASFTSTASSFCNESWETLFTRTGITASELWDESAADDCRLLYTARLYPVFSISGVCDMSDVLWLHGGLTGCDNRKRLQRWRYSWRLSLHDIITSVDASAEFDRRRDIYYGVAVSKISDTLLTHKAVSLANYYTQAAAHNKQLVILKTLDHVAQTCNDPAIAARVFANIADMLGAMAYRHGGLRSGPANNGRWCAAFQKLEVGDISGGTEAMSTMRGKWLTRPDLLIRAARHYEGGAQILIRNAVKTAKQYMSTSPCAPPAIGTWITASCPARADIAGGWSDTPPITYEHGGAVCNVAITIDGKKPIGAKARRIPELQLILHIGATHGMETLVITELSQLYDYCKPSAPGALLKATFVCLGIIELNRSSSSMSLQGQLMDTYGCGFELHTWSNLPHGSGLGTSSILAGAVIAVLWTCCGRSYTEQSLCHAVLYLEQVLTTGGGWQDQVGGLIGGIKVGHSQPRLPLCVEVKKLDVSNDFVRKINQHFLLVYTGKTRLAKNLLQNVVRNWYARDPQILRVQDRLVELAWDTDQAVQQEDLTTFGALLCEYWELKKLMAPGCEPSLVADMMQALRPHTLGLSLAGAGGGGFMYVITKQPAARELVETVIRNVQGAENATVHTVEVDTEGFTMS